MTIFIDWSTLPDSVRPHLDALEIFISDVDGLETDDGSTIDADE
jgi:hypothetical protein